MLSVLCLFHCVTTVVIYPMSLLALLSHFFVFVHDLTVYLFASVVVFDATSPSLLLFYK